jgi:methyltransferase family protein
VRLVEFHEEESQIVLPRLLAENREFDLAFLAGNHWFEAVFLDLYFSGRLVKEDGVVFVDDMQLPGVRRAVAYCIANLRWRVEERGQEAPHSWDVLRTGPREMLDRPFDELSDF